MSIIDSDLRRLDLNLLLAFHALMAERNVTRAAERLFIGQPALSGALKRLRSAFGDELFVRTRQGMAPTPRAVELAGAIDPLLLSLQQALRRKPSFDPGTAERVFHIGLSDALEVALMPKLVQQFARTAPGIRLISSFTDRTRASSMLDAGEIDLAIGVFDEASTWHRGQALFDWTFVCVFDPRHIALPGGRLTLEDYLAYPHLLTSFSGELHGFIDEKLEGLGHRRNVLFASRNFATNPLIVRQMAAFATVPSFVADAWAETLQLSTASLPFESLTTQVSLLWTAISDADAGLAWLIAQFEHLYGRGAARSY